MIAVSNTTPLRYLIAIEQEHLLGQLFEKIMVPAAVHEELTEARTPEKVRRCVLSLPAWYEYKRRQKIKQPHSQSPFIAANAKRFCWRKRCGRMSF